MPVNAELSLKTWRRFVYCRDVGHAKYVHKADKCERFFAGDQWEPADRAKLAAVQRPALTINKIMATVSNVMGEQINNRAEISFRPRGGSSPDTADILNKVYKQISDNCQLDWKRSEMFADGIITGRGFLDVRLDYGDSMQGEVSIANLNPKNVIVDPDGEDYDPDKWSEVFISKWLTADDIAMLYSKEDAEELRSKVGSSLTYSFDSMMLHRDRFGDPTNTAYAEAGGDLTTVRNIRVIERQYRQLDRQKHFLDPRTGDMRPVPEEFNRDRIAFFVDNYGLQVVPKVVRRIRWTVVADNIVLHDDWSPYKHLTVVPYFPHFRRGRTIGLVENLIGPQELLNKVTSQELHVVNTTANSGYKVRAGALTNMTVEELEEKGAQTGLVIEVNGDPDKDVQKIAPNQVPQGLDRISYKAEESIKTISGISDSMQGMDRADVAAKAIQAKQKAGSTNLVKPLDNLVRTDGILARNILDLVQEFYTEPRLMSITHDQATGASETFAINQPNPEPETGMEPPESPYQEIINDLTLGEYDVVVTSVPVRETLEDSQFEQAMALREAGVSIPDEVLIDASRLQHKREIIQKIQAQTSSPEAQQQQQLQTAGVQAELAKTQAEAQQKQADAQLKQAKVQETLAKTEVLQNGEPDDGSGQAQAQAKMAEVEVKARTAEHKMSLDEQLAQHKMSLAEREHALKEQQSRDDLLLKQQDMAQKRMDARRQAEQQAAQQAARPAPRPTTPR